MILSACYMLWCVQRVLFNPLNNSKNRALPDLNFREAIMLIPLCGFIIVMGVFPAPFLRRMEPRERRRERAGAAGGGGRDVHGATRRPVAGPATL